MGETYGLVHHLPNLYYFICGDEIFNSESSSFNSKCLQSKSELFLTLSLLLSPMLNDTSLYFRTCQGTSGLDLPYLHRTRFTTRVSHFLDSSFVLHFTLWQVARKTFIVLNLVARVSLLCTVLPTKETECGGGGLQSENSL